MRGTMPPPSCGMRALTWPRDPTRVDQPQVPAVDQYPMDLAHHNLRIFPADRVNQERESSKSKDFFNGSRDSPSIFKAEFL